MPQAVIQPLEVTDRHVVGAVNQRCKLYLRFWPRVVEVWSRRPSDMSDYAWCRWGRADAAVSISRPLPRVVGQSVPEVLSLASNRLRASREEIFEALQAEEITSAHRFVLAEIMAHIQVLEGRIVRFDAELLRNLHDAGYAVPLRLLQTLPGIDLMCAACFWWRLALT